MNRALTLLLSSASLLAAACSSSTAPSKGTAPPQDSGPADTAADTGEPDTANSCVAVGDNCEDGGTFSCCVAIDGPAVGCGTRAGTSGMLCLSGQGGPCKGDTDCQYGSCGSGGTCVLSQIGGPCMVNGDCNDITEGGKAVVAICSPADVCEVETFDGGSPADGAADDGSDDGG